MVCTFTNVVQQIKIFFPRKGLVNRKLTEFKSSESEQLTSLRKFLKLRRVIASPASVHCWVEGVLSLAKLPESQRAPGKQLL